MYKISGVSIISYRPMVYSVDAGFSPRVSTWFVINLLETRGIQSDTCFQLGNYLSANE